jgi:hypothetical protein
MEGAPKLPLSDFRLRRGVLMLPQGIVSRVDRSIDRDLSRSRVQIYEGSDPRPEASEPEE